MKTTFNGKGIEIKGKLEDWLEKKIAKLDKYLREAQEVNVKLVQQTKERSTCEITIPLDGSILRVEESTADMFTSIDKCVEKMVRMIRRHRTKLDKRLRQDAFEEKDVLDEPLFEDTDTTPVRVKHFTMRPMAVEDAIAQMEMLGHSFYLFMNADTQGSCVVYRRADGNYGLLQPDNA